MDHLKPITVWSLGYSPNPWKVILILEELGLRYEKKVVTMKTVKEEPYISLNPNGRVPTIEDPNTEIVLFESGAIIEYLIETYDKTGKLTLPRGSPEAHKARAWSYFQCSGQGPYFGQLGWFGHLHPEKIPSAIQRYRDEVLRINGVIDLHLHKTGNAFIMGNDCTYVDLMFVPYMKSLELIIAPDLDTTGHERFTEWKGKLYERPAVKKVSKLWEDELAASRQQS